MTMISIPVPEELEDVLKPVLERDPAKGAEWVVYLSPADKYPRLTRRLSQG